MGTATRPRRRRDPRGASAAGRDGGGGHASGTAGVLALQRSAGNRATVLAVQRLKTRGDLITAAGAPTPDKTFMGMTVRLMGVRYKAVLFQLSNYHAEIGKLKAQVPVDQVRLKLGAVKDAVDDYLKKHDDNSPRSAQMRLLLLDIEAELEAIEAAKNAGEADETWAAAIASELRAPAPAPVFAQAL